jgi:ABC-type dipeptide/oligopeptide/nickel transport system permease component
MLHLIPGDPVLLALGEYADAESIAELRHQLGLDLPIHVQYAKFIFNYVTGDLGCSLRTKNSVIHEVFTVLPYTLELAFAGIFIAVTIGVFTGVVSAVWRNSLIDQVMRIFSLLGKSMPVFWFGLLLIAFFSLQYNIFPAFGAGNLFNVHDTLIHLTLPSLTLGLVTSAGIARVSRSALIDVLSQDYIRTAYGKGASKRVVVFKHALKNAAIPIVTIIGLNFGSVLGGAILTETVFSRPGLGTLLVRAILWRDYPVVQGTVFFISFLFILTNLVTDITYVFFDPKIKFR